MPINLKNEYLSLEIQEPEKIYRGSRFDWTGQIIQITYLDKHTFCTTETKDQFLKDKLGRGLYNEFGIDQPVGYNDCLPGEKFPKIGIGLLTKKSSDPYDFFQEYEITPYLFSFSIENTAIEFCCKTDKNQKFAFQLNKRIELNANSFTIHYTLYNNGKEEINTNEYIHNFLSINGKQINEQYKLFFPFTINTTKFNSIVNPENAVWVEGNSLMWNKTPSQQFFIDNLNCDYSGKGHWLLVHLEDKVGIEELTDFDIQKINLWGSSHVVSPEIFFRINIKPGDSLSWVRTYKTFILD